MSHNLKVDFLKMIVKSFMSWQQKYEIENRLQLRFCDLQFLNTAACSNAIKPFHAFQNLTSYSKPIPLVLPPLNLRRCPKPLLWWHEKKTMLLLHAWWTFVIILLSPLPQLPYMVAHRYIRARSLACPQNCVYELLNHLSLIFQNPQERTIDVHYRVSRTDGKLNEGTRPDNKERSSFLVRCLIIFAFRWYFLQTLKLSPPPFRTWVSGFKTKYDPQPQGYNSITSIPPTAPST